MRSKQFKQSFETNLAAASQRHPIRKRTPDGNEPLAAKGSVFGGSLTNSARRDAEPHTPEAYAPQKTGRLSVVWRSSQPEFSAPRKSVFKSPTAC